MQKFEPKIPELLNHLHRHRVDFIVVGGVCAVRHGAPVTTFDLDVAHSRSAENLHRPEAALQSCDAHYRNHPKKIRPDAELLASKDHHLLMTIFGPLDLLGTIEKGLDYSSLIEHSNPIRLDDGIFYLLDLEFFIRIKSDSPFEKDRMKTDPIKELRGRGKGKNLVQKLLLSGREDLLMRQWGPCLLSNIEKKTS